MARSTVPRCFVSYCWDDIDRPAMNTLLSEFRKRLKGELEFVMDEHSLQHGHSIPEFIKFLLDVDGVLLLLTPGYKRKVVERSGGVHKEFSIIVDRFFKRRERRTSPGLNKERFILLPVLLSGTHTTSVPNEIIDYKYADFTAFRVIASGRSQSPRMSNDTRRRFKKDLNAIADELLAVSVIHSKPYEQLFAEYFNDLFGDLKAGWTSERYLSEDQHRSLFVKTRVYERVHNQAACFIIGRKGSGKSTLAQIFSADLRGRYLASININADIFNLELIYMIFEDLQIKSDMRNIVSRDICFTYAWSLFFYLALIDCIALRLELNTWQRERAAETLTKHLEQILDKQSDVPEDSRYSAYFVYCCQQVKAFVRRIIDEARPDENFFLSDIQLGFTRKNFFRQVFPAGVYSALEEIFQSLSKRFLITLDGFDSIFATFRRDSIGPGVPMEFLRSRAQFEVAWLRALLTVALRIRAGDPSYGHSAYLIDYCLTVPKDRFVEVRDTERDGYQYSERYSALVWSGIELSILIRKRMERLGGYLTKKLGGPRVPARQRLHEIWSERFGHVPELLEFEFNGKAYRMPTFIYILRHTFWRPRDVLVLTARVLALGEEARRRGQQVSVAAVRRAVKDSTEEHLQTEFIGEYSGVVVNFPEVIRAFQGCRQVLGGEEIIQIVRQVSFEYATGIAQGTEVPLERKLEYLYEIGMIGIRASESLCHRFALDCRHAFFFNEGRAPMLALQRIGASALEFIVHPVFSEYLSLDTSTNELIFDFGWDYLEENENRMFSQPQRWF